MNATELAIVAAIVSGIVSGVVSGIAAGMISARSSVRKHIVRSQDSQTVTNSDHVMRDDNRTDNRLVDNSQNAWADEGNATNIGGDQNNWRN